VNFRGATASLRAAIREHDDGPLSFADDLDCYALVAPHVQNTDRS
jgi:hypothetical protein